VTYWQQALWLIQLFLNTLDRNQEVELKIIRAKDQAVKSRGEEGRKVRSIINEHVGSVDWLMVTNSYEDQDHKGPIRVGDHTHPNAVEVIIFNKPGKLKINGNMYHFDVNDTVFLESSDIHGTNDMDEHDCTCILIGRGKPQKRLE